MNNLEFMKKFRTNELYHAFPRYDKVVNLFNIDWKDEKINNTLINFSTAELLDDELLFKIRDYMK